MGRLFDKQSKMSQDKTLPCLKCGKCLTSAVPLDIEEEGHNQPADGLALSSYGHYGSCAFDPMDGSYLEINLCDVCVLNALDDGHAKKFKVPRGTNHPSRAKHKPVRNYTTTESADFWSEAEKVFGEVESWPDWKRAGINTSDLRSEPRELPDPFKKKKNTP